MKFDQNPSQKLGVQGLPIRQQDGMTLVEVIAAIAVGAVITLGAVSLLSGAFSGADASKVSTELQALTTGSKKYASSQGGFANISMASLDTLEALPKTLKKSGTSYMNSFGGTVELASSSADKFTITYNKMPKQACIEVVVGGQSWDVVKVATTAVTVFTLDNAGKVCTDGVVVELTGH